MSNQTADNVPYTPAEEFFKTDNPALDIPLYNRSVQSVWVSPDKRCVVFQAGPSFYVEEARALRDWLDLVLPPEPADNGAIIAKFKRMEKVGDHEFPYYETYQHGRLIGRGGPPSIVSIDGRRTDCTWEPIANSRNLLVKLTDRSKSR
jgi:hypothetical protein